MRYASDVWLGSRAHVHSHYYAQLQVEFDRLLLFGVFALLRCEKLGTWQFLTELPYNAISPMCLARVQYLLRCTDEVHFERACTVDFDAAQALIGGCLNVFLSLRTSYSFSDTDRLVTRVSTLEANEAINLLTTLAHIAQCEERPLLLLEQLFTVCFINETTRETLYRAGGEIMAAVIDMHPHLFSHILRLVDRSMSLLNEVNVDTTLGFIRNAFTVRYAHTGDRALTRLSTHK